jgi:hypothetical protein
MKTKLLEKLAIHLLPKLLEITIKLLENWLKEDLNNDGKIG